MARAQRMKVGAGDTEVKTCKKCGEVKALDQFYKRKDAPDGRRGVCKACCDERVRACKERNPERYKALALERQKRYYQRHRDEILPKRREAAKQYYWDNRERVLDYWKQFRIENKQRIKDRNHRYHALNRRRINQRNRTWHAVNRERVLSKKREYRLSDNGQMQLRRWKRENKEHVQQYRKSRYARERDSDLLKKRYDRELLRDGYIKQRLRRTGFFHETLVEAKRQHLKVKRLIHQKESSK